MRKPFSITVVSAPFVILPLAGLVTTWLAFSWRLVVPCAVRYLVRLVAVTAGWLRVAQDIGPSPAAARS